jgi:hypothetical protein
MIDSLTYVPVRLLSAVTNHVSGNCSFFWVVTLQVSKTELFKLQVRRVRLV